MGQNSGPLLPVVNQNNVYGTYIHGIFDSEEIIGKIIRALCDKKGICADIGQPVDLHTYKVQQYAALADAVRKNIDLSLIKRIMGL